MAKMDVTEISWRPFGAAKSYRLFVIRIKRRDNQGYLFSGGVYTWRAFKTNDQKTNPKQIIVFYNKGGGSERLFDVMKTTFAGPNCPARSCRKTPHL